MPGTFGPAYTWASGGVLPRIRRGVFELPDGYMAIITPTASNGTFYLRTAPVSDLSTWSLGYGSTLGTPGQHIDAAMDASGNIGIVGFYPGTTSDTYVTSWYTYQGGGSFTRAGGQTFRTNTALPLSSSEQRGQPGIDVDSTGTFWICAFTDDDRIMGTNYRHPALYSATFNSTPTLVAGLEANTESQTYTGDVAVAPNGDLFVTYHGNFPWMSRVTQGGSVGARETMANVASGFDNGSNAYTVVDPNDGEPWAMWELNGDGIVTKRTGVGTWSGPLQASPLSVGGPQTYFALDLYDDAGTTAVTVIFNSFNIDGSPTKTYQLRGTATEWLSGSLATAGPKDPSPAGAQKVLASTARSYHNPAFTGNGENWWMLDQNTDANPGINTVFSTRELTPTLSVLAEQPSARGVARPGRPSIPSEPGSARWDLSGEWQAGLPSEDRTIDNSSPEVGLWDGAYTGDESDLVPGREVDGTLAASLENGDPEPYTTKAAPYTVTGTLTGFASGGPFDFGYTSLDASEDIAYNIGGSGEFTPDAAPTPFHLGIWWRVSALPSASRQLIRRGGCFLDLQSDGQIRFSWNTASSGTFGYTQGFNSPAGAWNYASISYPNASGNIQTFVNGNSASVTPNSTPLMTDTDLVINPESLAVDNFSMSHAVTAERPNPAPWSSATRTWLGATAKRVID